MKIPISLHLPQERKVETQALIDSGARGSSFIDKNFVKKE